MVELSTSISFNSWNFSLSISFLADFDHRKQAPRVRSYIIFNIPEIKKGLENKNESLSAYQRYPAMGNANATPTDLAMLVIPLAALLYSAETTIDT